VSDFISRSPDEQCGPGKEDRGGDPQDPKSPHPAVENGRSGIGGIVVDLDLVALEVALRLTADEAWQPGRQVRAKSDTVGDIALAGDAIAVDDAGFEDGAPRPVPLQPVADLEFLQARSVDVSGGDGPSGCLFRERLLGKAHAQGKQSHDKQQGPRAEVRGLGKCGPIASRTPPTENTNTMAPITSPAESWIMNLRAPSGMVRSITALAGSDGS
jgi:hypothetical protein